MTTVHGERQESLLCPRGRLSEDDVHQLLGGAHNSEVAIDALSHDAHQS